MNGNISLGRINTETNQGQSKKQGIRRLNYRCHLNEEEGRREQEAGSTWPPTHSPILHISNWERAGKYTYSIDYNKYNTFTQTFIHMHTLTTVSKWKSHGRHTKEKGHTENIGSVNIWQRKNHQLNWFWCWFALKLLLVNTLIIKMLLNELDLLYPIPCRKYLKASVSFPGCKKIKISWSRLC